MAALEEKAKEFNIKAVTGTAVISAFGFIIALFWRDAIKELIAKVVPEGEGMAYSFAAAIIVTIIAVVAIYVVSRWMNISIREHAKKLKSKAGRIDNKIIGRDITIRKRRRK
jgi:DMSO/TMAO reductase YedYZ heme-binding membrane subunit